jgi:hypothetical protein
VSGIYLNEITATLTKHSPRRGQQSLADYLLRLTWNYLGGCEMNAQMRGEFLPLMLAGALFTLAALHFSSNCDTGNALDSVRRLLFLISGEARP